MLIFFALAFVQMPLRADLAIGDTAGPWVGDPAIGEARLVSAVTGTGDLQELPLGLEFRLAPGWKIYWRTPGEAGLPPRLELQLASGHAVTNDIHWPVPKRFDAFGFDNFGYDNKVILPITLRGHPKGAAVQIIGQMEALACADICVPFNGKIGLSIVDGPATASSHAMEIARYRAKIPRNSGASPFRLRQSGRMVTSYRLNLTQTALLSTTYLLKVLPVLPSKNRSTPMGWRALPWRVNWMRRYQVRCLISRLLLISFLLLAVIS